jgi:hypothetical protein
MPQLFGYKQKKRNGPQARAGGYEGRDYFESLPEVLLQDKERDNGILGKIPGKG